MRVREMLHRDVKIPFLHSKHVSAKQLFMLRVIISPVLSMSPFDTLSSTLGILLKRASVITSSMVVFPVPVAPVIANSPAEARGSLLKSISCTLFRELIFSNLIFRILDVYKRQLLFWGYWELVLVWQ